MSDLEKHVEACPFCGETALVRHNENGYGMCCSCRHDILRKDCPECREVEAKAEAGERVAWLRYVNARKGTDYLTTCGGPEEKGAFPVYTRPALAALEEAQAEIVRLKRLITHGQYMATAPTETTPIRPAVDKKEGA